MLLIGFALTVQPLSTAFFTGIINTGRHIRNLLALTCLVSVFEYFEDEAACILGTKWGKKKSLYKIALDECLDLSVKVPTLT